MKTLKMKALSYCVCVRCISAEQNRVQAVDRHVSFSNVTCLRRWVGEGWDGGAVTLTPLGELLGQRGVNPAHQQDESQVHDAAGDVGDGPGLR